MPHLRSFVYVSTVGRERERACARASARAREREREALAGRLLGGQQLASRGLGHAGVAGLRPRGLRLPTTRPAAQQGLENTGRRQSEAQRSSVLHPPTEPPPHRPPAAHHPLASAQCYVNINRPRSSLVEERLYPLSAAGRELNAQGLAEVRLRHGARRACLPPAAHDPSARRKRAVRGSCQVEKDGPAVRVCLGHGLAREWAASVTRGIPPHLPRAPAPAGAAVPAARRGGRARGGADPILWAAQHIRPRQAPR